MRKTVIILSVFALVGSAYSQATKKQETTNSKDTLTIFNNTDLVEIQNRSESQLFDIQNVDSVKYFTLKEKSNLQKVELKKIVNLEQAKKMLKGQVIWGKYDEETSEFIEDEQGYTIFKIVCRNGKTYYDEVYFIAYYPQEDILLCEGGHTSDVSFNLTTGEERENVGNLEYITLSPSKQYRLNGYDGGQECSYYFIQKKIDGKYQRIIDLYNEFEKKIDFQLCWILDAFWENDKILNISTTEYPNGKHEKLYYRIILK